MKAKRKCGCGPCTVTVKDLRGIEKRLDAECKGKKNLYGHRSGPVIGYTDFRAILRAVVELKKQAV